MKRALVTGASEGIGRAFATRLAKEGFQVSLVARNEARLKDLQKSIGSQHPILLADLSTREGTESIAGELTQNHFDLLVNNAGFGVYGSFADAERSKILSMVRTNIEALVTLSHAFLQKSQKGDALINVSSTLAFMPFPPSGTYAATKAFVTSFTEALWFEQKKRGIYVMGLCPGITATEFHARSGGHSKGLPKSMTQSAEQVVDVAMKALKDRKKPTVISGGKNRILAAVPRFLPRTAVISLTASADGK